MIFSTEIYNDFLSELNQEISRIENRAFNGRSAWCAQNFEEANSSAIALLQIDIEQLNLFQENPDTKLHKDTYETLYGFQENDMHEITSKEFDGGSQKELESFEANQVKEAAFIQTYIYILDETQK
jgi:hypothetical protein